MNPVSPFPRRQEQDLPHLSKMAVNLLLASFSVLAAAEIPKQASPSASRSMVSVSVADARGKPGSEGSGVVVEKDRVVTSCSLVQKAKNIEVARSGMAFKAVLQYALPDRDLCQLSVPHLDADLAIPGAASKVWTGQRLYLMGAPKGREPVLTAAVISNLKPYAGSQYMQVTASISAVFNGGGLFDDNGRLIGILSLHFIEGENLTFALPVEWIGELEKQAEGDPAGKARKDGGLEWLNHALALEKQGDWAELLKISQHQLRHDPTSAAAWSSVGVAFDHFKSYNQAVHAYREAIRHQAEYGDAWHNLGNAYANLKEYDHAVHALRDALLIQPENDGIWYDLGKVYYDLKQYAYAINAYRNALQLQAENPKAWYNLGITYDDLNLYGEAAEAYQETVRIQPENADAWYNLGVAYARLGERRKLREIYLVLRKLSPAKAERYFNTYILP